MQPIIVGLLVVIDEREDASEKNEENIKEVDEGFTSMKGNLDILKN